ncbi:MAG: hypothetical protein KME38_21305 [Spirirestis rafaelensis WJT71-NPBG6]|nr:hypothetical protein [Spirirestis rafaelensis WJT71-NPBG6]
MSSDGDRRSRSPIPIFLRSRSGEDTKKTAIAVWRRYEKNCDRGLEKIRKKLRSRSGNLSTDSDRGYFNYHKTKPMSIKQL